MQMELVDLVNENDEVIGTIDRNSEEFAHKKNVRGVELFLITRDNKIVIPKRSSNRRIFPNCYDLSAAGMVDSKEDYETAMYRELKEELFIDNISLKEIAYLNPYKNESELFIKLYIGYIDSEIEDYDKDGIAQIYYLTIDEINDLLKGNPKQFKDNFIFSYNIL
ncbi:MAG: NUDIX domain-containing protein, partial [Bacilli bacterium]|nr:NUDIX domain-containing protein [Bacilli bacterium]